MSAGYVNIPNAVFFAKNIVDGLYISAWVSALLSWKSGQCKGFKVQDGTMVQIPALFLLYCSMNI